jgi:hypothetical protein
LITLAIYTSSLPNTQHTTHNTRHSRTMSSTNVGQVTSVNSNKVVPVAKTNPSPNDPNANITAAAAAAAASVAPSINVPPVAPRALNTKLDDVGVMVQSLQDELNALRAEKAKTTEQLAKDAIDMDALRAENIRLAAEPARITAEKEVVHKEHMKDVVELERLRPEIFAANQKITTLEASAKAAELTASQKDQKNKALAATIMRFEKHLMMQSHLEFSTSEAYMNARYYEMKRTFEDIKKIKG